MKGTVALLIVALFQYANGIRVSSCIEEINHAPDLNGQGCFSDKISNGAEYYLRAVVPDQDVIDSKYICTKIKFEAVENGKRNLRYIAHHEKFTLNIVKELSKVEKSKVLGKEMAGKMAKSVTTSYEKLTSCDCKSFLPTVKIPPKNIVHIGPSPTSASCDNGRITDEYYPHEERLRHPGISYYTSLFLDGDIWGFWECDRHAKPGKATKDSRFFFTKGLNVDFKPEHPEFIKYKGSDNPDEKAFEGELAMLPEANAQKCLELKFDLEIA